MTQGIMHRFWQSEGRTQETKQLIQENAFLNTSSQLNIRLATSYNGFAMTRPSKTCTEGKAFVPVHNVPSLRASRRLARKA